jgi:hypothetical protein
MKVLSVTWSYDDDLIYKDSRLYKSFIKYNSANDFLNIHFNRNNYIDIEEKFKNKFGFQYEYILYKIFLLKEKLNITNDNFIIYADTNDVACISNISKLNNFLPDNHVLFSSESNQYPSSGKLWNSYSIKNMSEDTFLNSGLFMGSKKNIERLLNKCLEDILPLEYKDFGGDQGVYTYNYINYDDIILDTTNNIFLSTYLKSPDSYNFENSRIVCKKNNTKPIFIHDNGWNYGSPRFIEKFNLI